MFNRLHDFHATTVTLIVDFASANTWVGANKRYPATRSSSPTGNTVAVNYGFGSMSGAQVLDSVSLGSGLNIGRQSIGNASSSSGFKGFDGVLGLGPANLSIGTLFPNSFMAIPTITDNLFSQGTISANMIGVSYLPVNTPTLGEISFGGIDNQKIVGPLITVPITQSPPSNKFWGLDMQMIQLGENLLSGRTAGIFDGGVTKTYLADDMFQTYKTITGATLDYNGFYYINMSAFALLPTMFFFISSDEAIILEPDAQIWPRSLNTEIGSAHPCDRFYLAIDSLGNTTKFGDFILGFNFLQRYYTAYDTTERTVSFATTMFTTSIINSLNPPNCTA